MADEPSLGAATDAIMAQSLPGGYRRWIAHTLDDARACGGCGALTRAGFTRTLWRPVGPQATPTQVTDDRCASCFWREWSSHLWGLSERDLEATLERAAQRDAQAAIGTDGDAAAGQKHPADPRPDCGGDPPFQSPGFQDSKSQVQGPPLILSDARNVCPRHGETLWSAGARSVGCGACGGTCGRDCRDELCCSARHYMQPEAEGVSLFVVRWVDGPVEPGSPRCSSGRWRGNDRTAERCAKPWGHSGLHEAESGIPWPDSPTERLEYSRVNVADLTRDSSDAEIAAAHGAARQAQIAREDAAILHGDEDRGSGSSTADRGKGRPSGSTEDLVDEMIGSDADATIGYFGRQGVAKLLAADAPAGPSDDIEGRLLDEMERAHKAVLEAIAADPCGKLTDVFGGGIPGLAPCKRPRDHEGDCCDRPTTTDLIGRPRIGWLYPDDVRWHDEEAVFDDDLWAVPAGWKRVRDRDLLDPTAWWFGSIKCPARRYGECCVLTDPNHTKHEGPKRGAYTDPQCASTVGGPEWEKYDWPAGEPAQHCVLRRGHEGQHIGSKIRWDSAAEGPPSAMIPWAKSFVEDARIRCVSLGPENVLCELDLGHPGTHHWTDADGTIAWIDETVKPTRVARCSEKLESDGDVIRCDKGEGHEGAHKYVREWTHSDRFHGRMTEGAKFPHQLVASTSHLTATTLTCALCGARDLVPWQDLVGNTAVEIVLAECPVARERFEAAPPPPYREGPTTTVNPVIREFRRLSEHLGYGEGADSAEAMRNALDNLEEIEHHGDANEP